MHKYKWRTECKVIVPKSFITYSGQAVDKFIRIKKSQRFFVMDADFVDIKKQAQNMQNKCKNKENMESKIVLRINHSP